MTATRQALIAKLVLVQGHEAHANRDIMTITGFMNEAQIATHIDSCISQIADYELTRAAKAARFVTPADKLLRVLPRSR